MGQARAVTVHAVAIVGDRAIVAARTGRKFVYRLPEGR